MATYTTYKNLEKPDVTELYNVNIVNKNSDILDSELHKIELSIGNQNELFATKLNLNNEISRAIARENEIASGLFSEISRAASAEKSNSDSITAERERAVSKENSITNSLNKHIENQLNPHQVTKAQIGLSNADNTSDLNKPVSTAQQNAIDDAIAQSNYYTDEKITGLIDGAPETLDTLKEVADAIAENETIVEALNAAIGNKANQSELDTHTRNDVIHVTQTDKNNWNDADIKKHVHDNKSILDDITSDKITKWDLSVEHISDSVKHITEEERGKLNNSYEHSELPHASQDAEKNIIVGIQRNGADLPVSDDRKVNIEIPITLSSFENDTKYISEEKVGELLSDYSNTEEVQQLINQSISQIPDSRDGLSAYEIALSHGFSGTEEEWVISLKGKDGSDGNDGSDGFSPEIVPNENNSDTVYKLNITTATGSFTTPNLLGADGGGNSTGTYGLFAFEIREDGHLWMVADSEIQGQNFHINNDGCLIYTLEG